MASIALSLMTSNASAEDDLPNAVPTVMYRRWAAALSYGASAVRARTDDAAWNTLAFIDMALRYRVLPHLEVGASLGGSFTRELGFVTIHADVRYRMMSEMAWNPFLFGSIGVASWSPEDGFHFAVRAGVGVERRFQQWAFSLGAEVSRIADDPTAPAGDMRQYFGVWSASLSMAALYYWGSGGRSLRRHRVP